MRVVAVVVGMVLGCGSVKSGTTDGPTVDTPEGIDAPVDAPPTIQHLYVGNDNAQAGVVARFTLPLLQTSTVDFSTPALNAFDVAFDQVGDMIVQAQTGDILVFLKPVTATSSPIATFKNGAATAGGQTVLTSAGTMIAAAQSPTINVFVPPFTNSSVPTSAITDASIASASGVGLDNADNLYVSTNSSATGGFLVMFPPPYNTASVITSGVAGTAYRKVAVIKSQLFVTSVGGSPGRVDVYTLPLVKDSVPAFSIVSGINIPEAIAADADGRLYVGNLNDTTVTRFSAPFSAASVPDVTVKVAMTAFTIFGMGIGP